MRGYYFITDAALSVSGVMNDVAKAVTAGVEIIQYRNKTADTRTLYDEAGLIKEICAGTRSRLIINDRVDIALAVRADGVHIGQEDMPYGETRRLLGGSVVIGVTVHDVGEALEAEAMGADYIGVSPVYSTGTKQDAGEPCGTETLAAIRRACSIPVVAIGGIDLSNVERVIAAGADMVCAISAVVAKPDVAAEILKFQGKFGL
ncbi:MAG: thiamine phosphate synthase [Spirochaetes bacterium]|nr:thiamine phosphate synthase [Spirochaetota bacterium]